jgi:hypothetical protein
MSEIKAPIWQQRSETPAPAFDLAVSRHRAGRLVEAERLYRTALEVEPDHGLEWDERCSAFHETRRPVTTSSATQVRQPLFDSSIGRWPPYAAVLKPLLDELGAPP